MNWKKLTLLSGIALAAVAVPCATAQHRGGGNRSFSRDSQISARASGSLSSASRGSSSAQFRSQTKAGSASVASIQNGSNRYRNGSNGRHHYRRYYGYYPGFYPYGFGYGYGGYGYPFYGSSAALYYNGYHPYAGYQDRARDGGGNIVAQVQQELSQGGFYRGPIDGVIGNGTRSAIRAYERRNGLRVDGQIDDQLLSSMGLS